MADIKINLLPWREELREARKQEFLKVLISLVLLAAAIIFGGDRFYNARIDTQQARNAFIDKEIKVLEDRIDEIKLLQQKRNELLARMKVIQELQGNRPVIVRLFDELARRLADRVYFTSLQSKGKSITIDGVRNRITEFPASYVTLTSPTGSKSPMSQGLSRTRVTVLRRVVSRWRCSRVPPAPRRWIDHGRSRPA